MLYRGILGAYVYACDENLREYLKEHLHFSRIKPTLSLVKETGLKIYSEAIPNGVPFYDLKVAAGSFGDFQEVADPCWIDLTSQGRLYSHHDYFVCQVVGESMNRKIPNGSYCLFRRDLGGSRQGKIVLVGHRNIQDQDHGGQFTVKRYHSKKTSSKDGSWQHESIVLSPESSDDTCSDIVIDQDEAIEMKVYGEFIKIIG